MSILLFICQNLFKSTSTYFLSWLAASANKQETLFFLLIVFINEKNINYSTTQELQSEKKIIFYSESYKLSASRHSNIYSYSSASSSTNTFERTIQIDVSFKHFFFPWHCSFEHSNKNHHDRTNSSNQGC